jgi:ketosteroid isomerase-like protein
MSDRDLHRAGMTDGAGASTRMTLRGATAALVGAAMHACTPAPTPAPPPDPEVLMEADRAFAAAVAAGGSEAWASWFADDGSMVQPGVGLVSGHETILAFMAGLDRPGVVLRWDPDHADIAASGDLGWTTGTFESESPGPDGEVRTGQGRYVTIWRKQADSSWKVAMDLGNPTEEPSGGG